MANLKEVRIRIASVQSTQQITSAMKMVAASKLRKAQNAILQMRPYAAKLKEILQNLSASLDVSDGSVYSEMREPNKVLLIAISSNRGLCGAFNTNVIKETNHLIANKYQKQFDEGNLSIVTIGKKVSEFFVKGNYNVLETHDDIFSDLSFDNVSEIADTLMGYFEKKEYNRIEVVYNQFKNAASQILTAEQFLPVEKIEGEETTSGQNKNIDYIFEPGKEDIVHDLIPKSLKIQLYKAILDSHAAEHGARMTAMHKATDNAQEMLKDLNLTYNKARQAAITNEILEIVSGAEALKG
ncbi:MAG: ATP synthase F1 subunit gamma [Bacteroidetes bacterium]|nr:MAG: ATP synthase F1 subunit gamma [Bacteroidota bacterium]